MSHQGIPDIKSVVGIAVGYKKESAIDSTDARGTYLKNSTYRERMREINIERLDNDSFVYRNFRLIQQKHPRSVVVEMTATSCGAIVASLKNRCVQVESQDPKTEQIIKATVKKMKVSLQS